MSTQNTSQQPQMGAQDGWTPAGQQSRIPNSGMRGNDQQNNQNDNDQGNNQNDQNNKQDNDDIFKNMWNTKKDDDGQNDNQNNNQQGNQQQNNQQQSPSDFLDERAKSLPFDINISNEVQAQLEQGDFSGLQASIRQSMEAVYKQGMLDSSRVMNDKIQKAVEEAVNRADASYQANTAISRMNAALDFTSDPQVKPVAEASLNAFLKQGMSVDDAIEKVGQSFGRMGRLAKQTFSKDPERFKSQAQDLSMDNNRNNDDDDGNQPDFRQILNS